MGYLTPAGVVVALDALANQFPHLCTRINLGTTEGGRPLTALEVHDSTVAQRIPVVITGGVHAREWAPPDALIDFISRILTARRSLSDVVYQPLVVDGVTYSDPPYVIDKSAVAKIFSRFNLIILPLVNPDGREFSMRGSAGKPTRSEQLWRKNRGSSGGSPQCVGVDINRNFDIAWKHREYYRPDAADKVAVSERPCDFQLYKGPSAFSEAESRAVRDLVTQKRATVFIDVHMHGRTIQYPWGLDRDQTADPQQNFTEAGRNHLPALPSSGRDGLLGNAYAEFVPADVLQRLKGLGKVMADEILLSAGTSAQARQRSTYTVGQTVDFGLLPQETFVGCSDDWAFSRQFTDPSLGKVLAFTVEAGMDQKTPGSDHDGGFFPRYATQFQKVAREIHAALFGLLTKGGF